MEAGERGPRRPYMPSMCCYYKGLVMIHDKRYVNFVEEQAIQSGVTPRIYVRSEHLGETNGTYGMAVDEQTGLLYSTHPAKRIDLFAPTGYGKEFHPNAPGNWLIKMYPTTWISTKEGCL